MTNFRALIPGGYFANGTFTVGADGKKTPPVSERSNNLGAVNGASWERTYPGYVQEIKYDGKNNTTIFEAPELGAAAYWQLLKNYKGTGRTTVWQILERYIGQDGVQDYFNDVNKISGMGKDDVVDIDNDAKLLPFAKAQFRHEAGRTIPWTDQQILYGFAFARAHEKGLPPPPIPGATTGPIVAGPVQTQVVKALPLVSMLIKVITFIAGLFKGRDAIPTEVLKYGMQGPEVEAVQKLLVKHGLLLPDQVDGDFGERTRNAVKQLQLKHNLDPDGEVGVATYKALYGSATVERPSAAPPAYALAPSWYNAGEKDIGFHETGVNQGIEKFIIGSKAGSVAELLGQPYCAVWVNYTLETSNVPGSRSAMARSFETSTNFVKLSGPALGAIVTNWRGSPTAGTGHVFLYDGENEKGVRGIGANEDDQIKRSFHPRDRIVGYYWPKGQPLPKVGKIIVGAGGEMLKTET